MKRIRQGNTINIRYTLYRADEKDKVPEDLTGIEIRVNLRNIHFGTKINSVFEVSENMIHTIIPGQPLLKTGVYNLSLYYNKEGRDYALDIDAFEIVDRSDKIRGVVCCPDMEVETVELEGRLDLGSSFPGGSIKLLSYEEYQALPDKSNQILYACLEKDTDRITKLFIGLYPVELSSGEIPNDKFPYTLPLTLL